MAGNRINRLKTLRLIPGCKVGFYSGIVLSDGRVVAKQIEEKKSACVVAVRERTA